MMSPGYLLNTPSTMKHATSPSLSEGSVRSPMPEYTGSSIMIYQPHNLPLQCYQNIMPPPPHNILTTVNNNIQPKNYNKNSWYGSKKNSKEGRPEKQNITHEKEKPSGGNSKVTSEDKKSLNIKQEKNKLNHSFYYPNQQEMFNGDCHSTCLSHRQQNVHYHKNRYFSNRTGNKNKKFTVSPERNTALVDILVERFLSCPNIVEARKNPKELITGSEWNTLSCEIWDFYLNMQQSEIVYNKKIMLWKNIYTFLGTIFPRYGLFLVGSTLSGFGTNTSDVDMCLLIRPSTLDQRFESLGFLEYLHRSLSRCDFVSNVEIIWAKVPILKFHDHVRNLNVDLNCNNSVGIRNTHLLRCYASLDWRVRPLVLVVKMWARSNNINNAKNMTMSSYSLALMVIHFLQCGVTPPVIPCLHGLYPGKFHADTDIHSIDMWEQINTFHSDNHQTLGELLLGFFHYYCRFEYNLHAISVRLGARIPIDECRSAKSSRNDPHQWKLLCIEEPFDLTNTARSVYDIEAFENIKSVFRNSYRKLQETRDLLSIFKQNDLVHI